MKSIFGKNMFLSIIGLLVAGSAFWAMPGLRAVPYAVSLYFQPPSHTLPVPVQGVKTSWIENTWGAPRSEGRRHEGIDIFGKRGTKILSTTAGIVTRVGDNRLGGRVVWVMGPGGYFHYYAHLEGYGDVKPWQKIGAGHFIGTVGDSGNAKGTPPHLHYGIYKLIGGALNPYPLLTRPREPALRNGNKT
jgi:murein DD-endopeptidase MepM/ murein hydrolase activator NlpD